MDHTLVAIGDENRQTAGVIQVSVGQDYCVQFADVEREGFFVRRSFVASTLKEATLEQHAGVLCFQQVCGTGYAFDGAMKCKAGYSEFPEVSVE